MTSASDKAVRSYVAEHADQFFEELKDWLRIPSISSDPEREDDVRRSAEWLAAKLREVGFPTVEIWETGGGAGLPPVFPAGAAGGPPAPPLAPAGPHHVHPGRPRRRWRPTPCQPAA